MYDTIELYWKSGTVVLVILEAPTVGSGWNVMKRGFRVLVSFASHFGLGFRVSV